MIRTAVAAALVAVVTVLLVVPFHPEAPALHLVRSITPDTSTARAVDWFVVESGGNFLVFALVGAAVFVIMRRPGIAIALACLLSAAAETAQLVIPDRVASWTDLATNCLGALAGVSVTVVASRARAHRTSTQSG